MKPVLFVLSLAVAALPATAQDHAAHATMPSPQAAAVAKFTLDTPIKALVADAKAKAVLDANLPGLTTHEAYDMFKTMSLAQLAQMAPDKLTPTALDKVRLELAAVR